VAKKVFRIAGGALGLATGGVFPGLLGYAAAKSITDKKKGPQGFGDPLPIGAINPDGTAIPVDKKRRRLAAPVATSSILPTSTPGATTLGG
jgi:hypothetical protein